MAFEDDQTQQPTAKSKSKGKKKDEANKGGKATKAKGANRNTKDDANKGGKSTKGKGDAAHDGKGKVEMDTGGGGGKTNKKKDAKDGGKVYGNSKYTPPSPKTHPETSPHPTLAEHIPPPPPPPPPTPVVMYNCCPRKEHTGGKGGKAGGKADKKIHTDGKAGKADKKKDSKKKDEVNKTDKKKDADKKKDGKKDEVNKTDKKKDVSHDVAGKTGVAGKHKGDTKIGGKTKQSRVDGNDLDTVWATKNRIYVACCTPRVYNTYPGPLCCQPLLV